jgi:hypothetical protein
MDEIVWKKLENLEMAGLAETAEKLLPPLVQIDNPKEAAGRVAALANLPPEAATEIEALALQTAHSSLRACLTRSPGQLLRFDERRSRCGQKRTGRNTKMMDDAIRVT